MSKSIMYIYCSSSLESEHTEPFCNVLVFEGQPTEESIREVYDIIIAHAKHNSYKCQFTLTINDDKDILNMVENHIIDDKIARQILDALMKKVEKHILDTLTKKVIE